MRIVSPPWPVACSAAHAVSTSPRYRLGALSLQRPPAFVHCGASQPAWLGSFQIAQESTRGSAPEEACAACAREPRGGGGIGMPPGGSPLPLDGGGAGCAGAGGV